MPITDCHEVELPKVQDPRGNLTFIESERHVPFKIKRVYYLYDVPGGATRAGHAHKTLQQVLIPVAGCFDVLLDDGEEKRRYHLHRPFCGLYIYPLTWRVIDNFSSGAVCLSIVSDYYDESDYFREYDAFLRAIRERHI